MGSATHGGEHQLSTVLQDPITTLYRHLTGNAALHHIARTMMEPNLNSSSAPAASPLSWDPVAAPCNPARRQLSESNPNGPSAFVLRPQGQESRDPEASRLPSGEATVATKPE